MATTANGTPYVESSDLVANYPAVSLALAEHIDDNTGKILQVVRATDTTGRTTTSASYSDASISVTITPQKSDSAVLLIWSALGQGGSVGASCMLRITDSSDVALSGAEEMRFTAAATNQQSSITVIGYSTPSTTSATTYKGRFRSNSGGVTVSISNSTNTGQLYAIEVSA